MTNRSSSCILHSSFFTLRSSFFTSNARPVAYAHSNMIVVADQKIARVKAAWGEFEEFIAAQPDVQLVAVDLGSGLDFSKLQAELVVVLGGDAALLRACPQMGMHQLPILGVNLGRLGFLADVSPSEFRDCFPQIRARQ